jgi:hypothetical protein
MDKADFIKLAPAYYELAVLLVAWERDGYFDEDAIADTYPSYDGDGHVDGTMLIPGWLVTNAIKKMVELRVLEVIPDDFGPTLYKRGRGIKEAIEEMEGDSNSPFYKSSLAPNRKDWLRSALSGVSSAYFRLGMKDGDFETPDKEWAPIPLERSDEELGKAITGVDDTIKVVSESNGYAATLPEERNYVLDNLKLLSDKLKTAASVSVGFVKRHGLEVLEKLQARFRDDMIAEVSKRAVAALIGWLTKYMW